MRLTLLAYTCAYLFSFSNLLAQTNQPSIAREVIADITSSIPSPIEMSLLIKDTETPYSQNLLTPIASYTTDFRQALHIGIYTTDLFYTTVYEQTPTVLAYLQNIKNTANDLHISETFDVNTLKKLASTRQHIDTVLTAITQNLENINEKLIGKDRNDLAILILTGSWIESLRLACEAYQKQPNEWLKNSIGEQKIILEQLLLLLSFYEFVHTDYRDLIKDLSKLSGIYEEVKITYIEKETTPKEGNRGEIITESSAESTITVLEETIKAIHQSTNSIYQFINQDALNPTTKTYIYKPKKEKPTKGAKFIIIDSKKIPVKYLYGTWEIVEVDGKPYKSKVSTAFTFLKDKTFIQTAGERKRKETWHINTNKNQIILTFEGKEISVIDVNTLTNDTLIYQKNKHKVISKKIKP